MATFTELESEYHERMDKFQRDMNNQSSLQRSEKDRMDRLINYLERENDRLTDKVIVLQEERPNLVKQIELLSQERDQLLARVAELEKGIQEGGDLVE